MFLLQAFRTDAVLAPAARSLTLTFMARPLQWRQSGSGPIVLRQRRRADRFFLNPCRVRILGLLLLWCYAVGFALGAFMAGADEPVLAVVFAISTAFFLWAAIEQSPRAILALCVVPWLAGAGMLSLATSSERRDATIAIVLGGVLWCSVCLGIAHRMRTLRAR